jgi:hypothetical protein
VVPAASSLVPATATDNPGSEDATKNLGKELRAEVLGYIRSITDKGDIEKLKQLKAFIEQQKNHEGEDEHDQEDNHEEDDDEEDVKITYIPPGTKENTCCAARRGKCVVNNWDTEKLTIQCAYPPYRWCHEKCISKNPHVTNRVECLGCHYFTTWLKERNEAKEREEQKKQN